MKFEVDFNREEDDKTLEQIGCIQEDILPQPKYPPFTQYVIELNTFEELEELLNKLNKIKREEYCGQCLDYSAIISFDPATIYFDNKI